MANKFSEISTEEMKKRLEVLSGQIETKRVNLIKDSEALEKLINEFLEINLEVQERANV